MFESKINRGKANGYAPWMNSYGMGYPTIIWYWVR